MRTGVTVGVVGLLSSLALALAAVPAVTGSTPLTVLTGSMEPTLPAGTVVVVRPVAAADISVGDVVTYQLRSGEPALVSHRVVGVRSASDGQVSFLTKGDANEGPDPMPVVAERIVGTVWYSVPFVGIARVALEPHLGWLRPILGSVLTAAGGVLMARRWIRPSSVLRSPAPS